MTARAGLEGRVDEPALTAAIEAIERDLGGLLTAHATPDTLVGVGGTVTNLAAVALAMAEYDPEVIQGAELGRDEVERQIERYRTMEVDERRGVVGLQPARAEVILGGACIVRAIMTLLERETLIVSDRGLRHGVVADRFGSGVVEG